MLKNRPERSVGVRRKTLLAVMALTALIAALGAASAQAAPKGEWAVFYDCPTSNPELAGCLVARSESGEIAIGKTAVPIVNVQTLQGGVGEEEGPFGSQKFYAAADGNTFSKTPQKVPGGLLNIVKCTDIKGNGFFEKGLRSACEAVFENSLTGVNATTELAAPASSIGLNENFLLGEISAPALVLPVKVKLENPLLGSECYIGSTGSPIVLSLTSGTTAPKAPNKPIKGKFGDGTTRAEGRILVVKNNTIVDNNFSVPSASGCGGIFSFLLVPIINSKLGLPSAAGNNTAILNNTIEQTGIAAAIESE
jgi:hypothetical protein